MNAEFTLLTLLVTFVRGRLAAHDDEGLSILEWVILIAIAATVAIAAAAQEGARSARLVDSSAGAGGARAQEMLALWHPPSFEGRR